MDKCCCRQHVLGWMLKFLHELASSVWVSGCKELSTTICGRHWVVVVRCINGRWCALGLSPMVFAHVTCARARGPPNEIRHTLGAKGGLLVGAIVVVAWWARHVA